MRSDPPNPHTALLARLAEGDERAAEELLPAVYEELRGLARAVLARERPGHTLQPTALVHEAFLRLAGGSEAAGLDRARFVFIAANCMRRVLVEHARARAAEKRGGGAARVTLASGIAELARAEIDVLELEEALEKLARLDERQARLVELRFHGGLSMEEAALALGVSKRSAEADWTLARAFLHRELAPDR